MNKISIYVAFVLLVILSSCSKKNGGDAIIYDVPTITANFTALPDAKISFQESGPIVGNDGKFNNKSSVKLLWNANDMMRLYDVTDNKWVADFKLADGENSPFGVFQLFKGGLQDNHTYISAVMDWSTYQQTEDDKDFPSYTLPSEFDQVSDNNVNYLTEKLIITSGDNVKYDGGEYVGKFSFKPNYALMTFMISCPSLASGYEITNGVGPKIESLSVEMTPDTGADITETLNFSLGVNPVLWTSYDEKLIVYMPIPAGKYKKLVFIMEGADDNTYGCEVSTTSTDPNEQLTRTTFSEGIRYKRYLTEWGAVKVDLEGNFKLPDITNSFQTGNSEVW